MSKENRILRKSLMSKGNRELAKDIINSNGNYQLIKEVNNF